MNRRTFLGASSAATAGLLTGGSWDRVLAQRAAGAASGAVVETTSGRVRGFADNQVNGFRAIPYGASTAGANRFMPPMRPAPWTGVRDAVAIGLRAPQLPSNLVPEFAVMDRTEPMGEDCLVLNVWSQGLRDGQKRPVMVWLHGGGFTGGSSGFLCYDGANLARKHDVVVVTVNHRLNIFGFLHLADIGGEKFAQASNAGMLDIVAALEWVRDNIAGFGGDPGSVTVFGQSGGSRKVTTLMGMPSAKGLFHRAIAMSGPQLRGVPRADATKTAEAVLSRLGLSASQVDRLQTVPIEQLLAVTEGGGRGMQFAPTVDERTLPAHMFDPVAATMSADIPLMLGSTETEITWNARQQYDPLDESALRERVKQTLRTDDASADRVIAIYRKNRPKASNLDLFLILGSDAADQRVNGAALAERKSALGKAPVYNYYFAWYSPVREGKLRSMHCMDIPFVFENVDIAKVVLGEGRERYALADKMSRAWVAFARTGKPNHAGLPNWAPFDATRRATMVLDNECKAVDDPHREERLALKAIRDTQTSTSARSQPYD